MFTYENTDVDMKKLVSKNNRKGNKNGKKNFKYVKIEEDVEEDWTILKSKSGYKTDELFLSYLLRLAKIDMYSPREKKIHAEEKLSPENNSSKCFTIFYSNKSIERPEEKKTNGENQQKKVEIKSTPTIINEKVNGTVGKDKVENVKQKNHPPNNEKTNDKGNILGKPQSNFSYLIKQIIEDERTKMTNIKKKHAVENIKVIKQLEEMKKDRLALNQKSEPVIRREEVVSIGSGIQQNTEFDSDLIFEEVQEEEEEEQENIFQYEDFNDKVEENDTAQKENIEESTTVSALHERYETDNVGNSVKSVSSHRLSFAEFTLPDDLYLKTVNADHGLSVFTKVPIKKFMLFGPLRGEKIKPQDITDDINVKYLWEVYSNKQITYINTQDAENSNWLRFIRPAEYKGEANVISFVKDGHLYFKAKKDIDCEKELLYWISDEYSIWSKKKITKKSCAGCDIQFPNALLYRKHCMIFHDPRNSLSVRKYYCKVCGFGVLGKKKLTTHALEAHEGKGAYQCQYCHKFFLRDTYLETHITYACEKIPQKSRSLCDYCGKKFTHPQKLKIHIKKMHSNMSEGVKEFQCKFCGKLMSSRISLNRHCKEIHYRSLDRAYTCDTCGKIFQNKSNLKIHMLTHSRIKPYPCQAANCNTAFTTKQCLQTHYQRAHGLTKDVTPKIERNVAYTFFAYSGGAVSNKSQSLNNGVVQEEEDTLDKISPSISASDLSGAQSNLYCSEIMPRDSSLDQDKERDRIVSPANESPNEQNDFDHDFLSLDSDFFQQSTSDPLPPKLTKKKLQEMGLLEPDGNSTPKNSNESLFLDENLINSLEVVNTEISFAPDLVSQNHSEIQDFEYEDELLELSGPGVKEVQLEFPKTNFSLEDKRIIYKSTPDVNELLKCQSFFLVDSAPFSDAQKDYNIEIVIPQDDNQSFSENIVQNNQSEDLNEVAKNNNNSCFDKRLDNIDSYGESENDFRLSFLEDGDIDFEVRDIDFEARDIDFEARDIDFETRDIDFETRDIDFETRDIDFETRDIDFETRDIDFETRDIDFDTRDIDIETRDIDFEIRDDTISWDMEKTLQMNEDDNFSLGNFDVFDDVDLEGDGENLCLKDKCLENGNQEEKNSLEYEDMFYGDISQWDIQNQNIGSPIIQGTQGTFSQSSYQPIAFENESIDLSLRPSLSLSPSYTLDLSSLRTDTSSDPKNNLEFPSFELPATDGETIQNNNYGVYQTMTNVTEQRVCPDSTFQMFSFPYS